MHAATSPAQTPCFITDPLSHFTLLIFPFSSKCVEQIDSSCFTGLPLFPELFSTPLVFSRLYITLGFVSGLFLGGGGWGVVSFGSYDSLYVLIYQILNNIDFIFLSGGFIFKKGVFVVMFSARQALISLILLRI